MGDDSDQEDTADTTSAIHRRWWGLVIKVLIALGVVAIGAWVWIELLEPRESELENTLRELGPWGPVIFVAVFVVATSIFFPESVLAIAAGAIFGLGWGLVWTVVAGFVSVSTVFMLGRHLLGSSTKSMLERHPKLAAVENAAESRGLRLVFLLRLSPLNFTVLNWMLAASRLRFRTVFLSALGMVPGNFSTVYVGYAARHTADLAARARAGDPDVMVAGDSIAREITLYAGLGASILVSVIVTRIAVKALRAANASVSDEKSAPAA
ncbi:MAG: hypothetical protein CMJ34_04535 [Phycisphaerae bacterium]|nr:hypothetical protein [Phycisphaerae bacterium]